MNRRETLEALKDRLIAELELLKAEGFMPLGKECAPLSRELRQVMAELESLPEDRESAVDKIFGGDEEQPASEVTDISQARTRKRGQRAASSERTLREERQAARKERS